MENPLSKRDFLMIDMDNIITNILVAIYSNDVLNEKLYLKGGQALRLAHDLKSRFSADADFSAQDGFTDKDLFFTHLRDSLYNQFLSIDLILIDFKYLRQPKVKKEGSPDFWGGWAVEFKIVDKKHIALKIESQRRNAIVPEGSESPKIKIDISEYEYCDSVETLKIQGVEVSTYSLILLVLEKVRAICQQHPDYKLKGNTANRARDYYDIERLFDKVIRANGKESFLTEAAKHFDKVMAAKEVPLDLLEKIFEDSFVSIQSSGWNSVKATVNEKIDDFEYYNETLKNLISDLGEIKTN
jgi:predicted nucleotidyltransferase component of viral defense system